MPTHTKSKIIQSDSRGRIVLPPDLRRFGLFELEADAKTVGHYHLYPLQTKRLMEKNQQDLPPAADWSRRYDYVNKKIMPAIQTAAMAWNGNAARQKSFLIQAVTLFGSYARKDAFHNSDLDLAFFISPFPSFSDRNRIQQHFETQLESEMKVFKTMGAACDLSLIFVTEGAQKSISPLAFSIAEEGIEVFSNDDFFSRWTNVVRETMKVHHVRALGEGRDRVWQWGSHGSS